MFFVFAPVYQPDFSSDLLRRLMLLVVVSHYCNVDCWSLMGNVFYFSEKGENNGEICILWRVPNSESLPEYEHTDTLSLCAVAG